MSDNSTVADFVEAQAQNHNAEPVAETAAAVPVAPSQEEATSNAPSDKELLGYYRYREKQREEAMLADPFLSVKAALTESPLEKKEQLALLEKIQEIHEKTGLKDMEQLANFTKHFAIPEYLSGKEQTRKNNEISEAVNFKWALDAYGDFGRKALESFRTFAREQWGDATPEYMRHDLFRARFPAFIEKNLQNSAVQSQKDEKIQRMSDDYEKFIKDRQQAH